MDSIFKYLLRIGVGLILLFPICSCGKKEPTYHIGVSQCSDDEWRRQMNDEIHREILFHEEADVEIISADDSSKKQTEDIRYFLNKGVDLLIVAPNEAEAVTPAIREAYLSGIPVIIFDRNINDTTFTSYIDLDNVAIGKAAGRYAAEAYSASGGAILELKGLSGSTPAEERHHGFQSSLEGKIPSSSILSVAADWKDTPAFQITDSLIQIHPEIKLIYAHNDVMAIAAARAARKNHRHDILVIGTDGAPGLGIKAVEDSLIQATFTYPTVGEEAIRLAMQILKGDSVGKYTHGPATTLITAENAPFFISMNNLFRQKTNRIEELNQKYSIISDQKRSQRITLYIIAATALLLLAAVFGLLYFIRQRNRFEKELSEKNKILSDQQKKQEDLYNRLEEATQSKLAFFTNISHDLRTPLALIADPVEKIANEQYLPASDKTLMKMVVRNVKILSRMIDQILDFRRFETGRLQLILSEADILDFMREWATDFEEYASRKGINFSFSIRNLTDTPHPTMSTDVEKMQRIVFNLLSNAFKFTPAGGRVTMEVSLDHTKLLLSISDTGKGIKEEERTRIFDRFYQVATPRPNGSGIGLSLTKAFVELLEGTIGVESVYGEGSTFHAEFPVEHTTALPDTGVGQGKFDFTLIDTASPDPDFTQETESEEQGNGEITDELKEKPILLVIDDNEDVRTLVKLMLSDRYDIIEASDGKEGLRLAMKYLPDVIVCDIMMPDMDGLEVTRRLKEERVTCHIPVLILTACRLDEQRVRSYDSGADGFISKPFTEVLLRARCEALIANRRRIYDLFLESTAPDTMERRVSLPAADEFPDASQRRMELDNDFYRDFMNILRSRYHEESLSISDISSQLGIGATQLTRKIKAITNTTPVEIIRGFRLRMARKRLLSSDDTVAEIAFSCGFSSPQYFARCFKETFNMTPTELRNSIRNH